MIDERQACVFSGYTDLQGELVAAHLSGLVRFPTVAQRSLQETDHKPFLEMRAYLEETYPLVHQNTKRVILNELSMLYRWPGTGTEQKPVVLMAHQDVVPVTPGTEEDWEHPAFGGVIAEGHVWGRGAIDMKNVLCAQFEAITYLMERGFAPTRDIYLALGHDEEVSGLNGAQAIVQYFLDHGIQAEFVLDEGGSFGQGEGMGASDQLVAAIAIFEKGFVNAEITTVSQGGHSSRPQATTALGDLCRALLRVEEHPFPPKLAEPFLLFFEHIGAYLDDPVLRELAGQAREREEELIAFLEKTVVGNAMVRTTIALTQASGSPAANVLPQKAVGTVNLRLNAGDGLEMVERHIKEAIGEGLAVDVVLQSAREASGISPIDTRGYRLLEETIGEFYPDMLVVPYGTMGGTDSRKFEPVTSNIYRLCPFFDVSRYGNTMHATNERISMEDLLRGTKFFIRFLERVGG